MRWTESFGVERYNVKRSMTPGGPHETVASVTHASYVDIDSISGTTNYYVVTALNTDGESMATDETFVMVSQPELTGTIIGIPSS